MEFIHLEPVPVRTALGERDVVRRHFHSRMAAVAHTAVPGVIRRPSVVAFVTLMPLVATVIRSPSVVTLVTVTPMPLVATVIRSPSVVPLMPTVTVTLVVPMTATVPYVSLVAVTPMPLVATVTVTAAVRTMFHLGIVALKQIRCRWASVRISAVPSRLAKLCDRPVEPSGDSVGTGEVHLNPRSRHLIPYRFDRFGHLGPRCPAHGE